MGKNILKGCVRKYRHNSNLGSKVTVFYFKNLTIDTFNKFTARHFVTALCNYALIDESWSNLLNVHAHRNTQTGPTKIGNILSYRVPFNYVECCWATIKKMRGNPRSQHKKYVLCCEFLSARRIKRFIVAKLLFISLLIQQNPLRNASVNHEHSIGIARVQPFDDVSKRR